MLPLYPRSFQFSDRSSLLFFLLLFAAAALTQCSLKEEGEPPAAHPIQNQITSAADTAGARHTDTIPLSLPAGQRIEVPILCYHHILPGKKSTYTVSEEDFRDQIKMLKDSGYHSILPDDLYRYLTAGVPLPAKPVMLTFDDTHAEHFSVAAPVLQQYGFKGVFFIMTIPINKPNYMSREQIKTLADSGHVIGCHTWDHHNVKLLQGEDWDKQLTKPRADLERITGKPVDYFAYPFGAWNEAAVAELKKRRFRAAFQLYGKKSEEEPLYTIRRILVPGGWSPARLNRQMKALFR